MQYDIERFVNGGYRHDYARGLHITFNTAIERAAFVAEVIEYFKRNPSYPLDISLGALDDDQPTKLATDNVGYVYNKSINRILYTNRVTEHVLSDMIIPVSDLLISSFDPDEVIKFVTAEVER